MAAEAEAAREARAKVRDCSLITACGVGKLDTWMHQIFRFPPTQIARKLAFLPTRMRTDSCLHHLTKLWHHHSGDRQLPNMGVSRHYGFWGKPQDRLWFEEGHVRSAMAGAWHLREVWLTDSFSVAFENKCVTTSTTLRFWKHPISSHVQGGKGLAAALDWQGTY